MNKNKYVCVYTICKNEEKNIRRWIESVKDADFICILDTGSTDKTLDIISEYPFVYTKTAMFTPFDFSKARNASLEYAKQIISLKLFGSENTSIPSNIAKNIIMVSLDCDEFLEENGINIIKESWKDKYDTMNLYGYTGNDYQIVIHKIHSAEDRWNWKRPVHEIIADKNLSATDWITGHSGVKYVHEQDLTKKRDYYELLKMAYENNPHDISTLIYLAWESYNHGKYEDYYKYSDKCIFEIYNNTEDEYYHNPEYLAQCFFNLHNYKLYFDNDKSVEVGLKHLLFIEENIVNTGLFPKFRRLYYMIAQDYWTLGDMETSIKYYKKCIDEVKEIPYCWIDELYLYTTGKVYSDLAIAIYYNADKKLNSLDDSNNPENHGDKNLSKVKLLHDFVDAIGYNEIALSYEHDNETYISNKKYFNQKVLDISNIDKNDFN